MQSAQEPVAAPGPRRPSALTIAVYGMAVVLVLAAALFARGFSRDIGDGRVAGRFSLFPLFGSRAPEELTLTWNGLALHFARAMTPSLKGVESAAGSTDLVFDGDLRLRLIPGTDTGGSITLAPVTTAGAASIPPLVVPYSVTGIIEYPPSGGGLSWKRAGRTFLFTLPQGARIDVPRGSVTLPFSAAPWTAVLHVEGVNAAARTSTGREAAGPGRLPAETAMPTEEKLRAALAAYTDAAYRGWSESRYSASALRWELADGSEGVPEDLGVALLAESVTRGTWQKIFPLWSNARALRQKQSPSQALDGTTSAYVGGVRDFAAALQADSAARVDQARAALERSDTALLRARGLVPLLANHGTADLVTKVGAFLAARTATGLDVQTAAGLAEALLDYTAQVRRDDSLLRLLGETVNRRILPAVRSSSAGLFLDTGAGRSDVQSGIACGALLMRAGRLLDSSLAQAVGRGLLVSCLSLSDEKGFLPSALVLQGGRAASREGVLAPETIYPLLPLVRFLPRETSLAAWAGPAAWIWTSAVVLSATGSAAGSSFTFSFPAGVPFHAVVQGIAPFALLKLHGIPWHSDPSYFKYSDGWAYDPKARALFMKVTGRSDRETIDISN